MILAIIQARMSSKRLPGKALMRLGDKPMLIYMIDRVRKSQKINKIVVATSLDPSDDVICSTLSEPTRYHNNICCYRGPLNNVLERFYIISALYSEASHIVRLTGDCPLIEPSHIDQVIDYHLAGAYDYTRDRYYPDGWDTEVMTRQALTRAFNEATDPYDFEHVTPYIYNHPELFKLGFFDSKIDYSMIKLSIDTQEDYEKICRAVSLNRLNYS